MDTEQNMDFFVPWSDQISHLRSTDKCSVYLLIEALGALSHQFRDQHLYLKNDIYIEIAFLFYCNGRCNAAISFCENALLADQTVKGSLSLYSFFDHVGHTSVVSHWRHCKKSLLQYEAIIDKYCDEAPDDFMFVDQTCDVVSLRAVLIVVEIEIDAYHSSFSLRQYLWLGVTLLVGYQIL
jgi:hypothetical protein